PLSRCFDDACSSPFFLEMALLQMHVRAPICSYVSYFAAPFQGRKGHVQIPGPFLTNCRRLATPV
ncbi:MAG: hypothetical protein AB7G25_14590, partial [Sphingomonadaceae bacterium]